VWPQITLECEIDINPLTVHGKGEGATAPNALIVVE
jgi:hypothetical protein